MRKNNRKTLYNNALFRKKGFKNIVWTKLLLAHSVRYHWHLGSRSVRFFHGVPLSKRGVPFRNFGTVRVPLSNQPFFFPSSTSLSNLFAKVIHAGRPAVLIKRDIKDADKNIPVAPHVQMASRVWMERKLLSRNLLTLAAPHFSHATLQLEAGQIIVSLALLPSTTERYDGSLAVVRRPRTRPVEFPHRWMVAVTGGSCYPSPGRKSRVWWGGSKAQEKGTGKY